MEQSGGLFLPPVQTLVATLVFALSGAKTQFDPGHCTLRGAFLVPVTGENPLNGRVAKSSILRKF
jgi:hypothetical protein